MKKIIAAAFMALCFLQSTAGASQRLHINTALKPITQATGVFARVRSYHLAGTLDVQSPNDIRGSVYLSLNYGSWGAPATTLNFVGISGEKMACSVMKYTALTTNNMPASLVLTIIDRSNSPCLRPDQAMYHVTAQDLSVQGGMVQLDEL